MVTEPGDMRHVVAWLPLVSWVTCIVLWAMLAAVGSFRISICPYGLLPRSDWLRQFVAPSSPRCFSSDALSHVHSGASRCRPMLPC
jgi:hypothetical protein